MRDGSGIRGLGRERLDATNMDALAVDQDARLAKGIRYGRSHVDLDRGFSCDRLLWLEHPIWRVRFDREGRGYSDGLGFLDGLVHQQRGRHFLTVRENRGTHSGHSFVDEALCNIVVV